MFAHEGTPSREYIDESEERLQLDHSKQFIEDPRFAISETGVALTNYDVIIAQYGEDLLPHIKRGFELEYDRFAIQLRRACENDNIGLFDQPHKEEYARINSELVELNTFVYTCYGLDLIGLINDRNRYQEQINDYFHQLYI